MTQMFNLRAEGVTSLRCGSPIMSSSLDDPEVPSFLRGCLASFKCRVESILGPHLAATLEREIRIVPVQVIHHDVPSQESELFTTTASLPNQGIIVVPKTIMAVLEDKLYKGNQYTFLITHPLHGKKTSAHVGHSTNPALDVYLHNHLKTNDRTTSAAAPHWRLDMVMGPFLSHEQATECSKEWVNNTRGMDSKRKRALLLSRMYGVPLYSASAKPKVPVKEYLRKVAPPKYMALYEKMTSPGIAPPLFGEDKKKSIT